MKINLHSISNGLGLSLGGVRLSKERDCGPYSFPPRLITPRDYCRTIRGEVARSSNTPSLLMLKGQYHERSSTFFVKTMLKL